jgi:hypothetical protein
MASFDPQFEYFSRHLDDPILGVCMQAMLGVGLLQMEEEAPRLVHISRTTNCGSNALPCYAMCAHTSVPCGDAPAVSKRSTLAGGLTMEGIGG